MKNLYFGGHVYQIDNLTTLLTADLDSVLKKNGRDVKTNARIMNGKLVVSIPLTIDEMTEDHIPIVLQSLIIGRDNIPNLPLGGFAMEPTVTTDIASIDEFYREAAREAGLQRYGHVRSILNTPSGIEITIG